MNIQSGLTSTVNSELDIRNEWKKNPVTGKYHRELPAFCLWVDIIGYSQLMEKDTTVDFHIDSTNFFYNCLDNISSERFPKNKTVELTKKMLRISDTLAIWSYPEEGFSEKECFLLLCEAATNIMQKGFKERWAIRGAIAFGTCVNDIEGNAVTGNPWIEAHLLECSQEWAGVSICRSVIEQFSEPDLLSTNAIIKHQISNCNDKELLVINWVKLGISSEDIEITFDRIPQPTDEKARNKAIAKRKNTIDFYNKGISIDPKFAHAYSNLGNVYKSKNNLIKAEECYKKSIEIN